MEIGEPTIICVKPYGSYEDEDSDEESLSGANIKPEKAVANSAITRSPAPPISAANGGSEQIASPQLATEEVSRTLEWFRETLMRIGKGGRITLKDLKYAARECLVRST